ncbi:MAG TPA: RNA 2',3'-cyclic phosphodiesterase [Aeromicrobium sp.]|nr:RNA 2',3'-cyclic phosphodiesterase [Aeromicrobium sp.]
MTRMFVATYPPPEAIDHLEAFLDPRREAADFRWTLPEQWHLTLAFLSDVPERAQDELIERLERAAAKRGAMTASITGGGAFPAPDRAKVLWAGLEVDEPDALQALASGCRAAAAKAGCPPSGERFRPHLTIGRPGRPTPASKWVRLLDSYRGPAWTLDEVTLVASHLGEGPGKRPRHEVLSTFPLS